MRKIFAGIITALLLTGCAATVPQESGGAVSEADEMEPGAELLLELEHETYDASLDSYTYLIRNGTEKTVEFGEAYLLQRWIPSPDAGRWENLTLLENAGFVSIGYALAPGAAMALSCGFGLFEEEPEDGGRYRLVKEADGQTLYGEFRIGDSPYTLETPYGFAPLEELPEIYGAAEADDGAVVFSGAGTKNMGAVEEFLFKVGLGAPCQLRTVQDYGEGTPMVIDAVYENSHFLWRVRSGGEIMERRFSYLVTDRTDICLSNSADWGAGEQYGDARAFLVPEGTAAGEDAALVEAATEARLAGNAARYRVWSGDGRWCAALTDTPTEFFVERREPGHSRGGLYDLRNWDGLETGITGLAWRENGALELTCERAGGNTGVLAFDPETEKLTDFLYGLPAEKT